MSAKADRAFRSLVSAAKRGNIEAQYQLAAMLATGDGAEKDLAAAANWYGKAAAKEHPEALYNLGIMHVLGETGRPAVKKGMSMSSAPPTSACGTRTGIWHTSSWMAYTGKRGIWTRPRTTPCSPLDRITG